YAHISYVVSNRRLPNAPCFPIPPRRLHHAALTPTNIERRLTSPLLSRCPLLNPPALLRSTISDPAPALPGVSPPAPTSSPSRTAAFPSRIRTARRPRRRDRCARRAPRPTAAPATCSPVCRSTSPPPSAPCPWADSRAARSRSP